MEYLWPPKVVEDFDVGRFKCQEAQGLYMIVMVHEILSNFSAFDFVSLAEREFVLEARFVALGSVFLI